MGNDRRFYTRYLVNNIDANIYVNGLEVNCKILNISEYGLCIVASNSRELAIAQNNGIVKEDSVTVQFICKNRISNQESVLTFKASIKHIEEKENEVIIGMYTNSTEFREFVMMKTVEIYRKKF